nr:hypothetical protein [Candidatus Sigynarchaeota archaeon]
MSVPRKSNVSNKLIALFFSFSALFLLLGIFSDYLYFEALMDFMIIGIIALVIAGLYLYVPNRFKIHLNGIITFMILTLLLISITNSTIQLFLMFFLAANMIYIVFYLGIYTACIDQTREEGIKSEEYIKDFNLSGKQEEKPERGFLLKTKQSAAE